MVVLVALTFIGLSSMRSTTMQEKMADSFDLHQIAGQSADGGANAGEAELHGVFIAAGPNIRTGVEIEQVEVVDIYPLMLSILGLDSPGEIDGDAEALAGVLRTGSGSKPTGTLRN